MSIFVILFFYRNFFQCFSKKNDVNTFFFIKKCASFKFEGFLNKKFYDDLIYINILNRCLNINKSVQELITYDYVILQNDLINKILIRNSEGIDYSEVNFLIQQYPILKNLRAGQTLSWSIMSNRNLKFLMWGVSSQEIRIYNHMYANFSEGVIRVVNQSNNGLFNRILFVGMLNGTFINSVRSLGIEENCVVDIVNALRCRLDFRRLRQGDKFAILIAIIINDNCGIQTKFLGARLNTVGKDYYVFRANNGKFYDHRAIKLTDNFMRFPVPKPFRISSSFNLHRLNPITRQISPHAGVDFAVPIGTPVFSVGDGEVIISAYSKISGNYLVIRHNYRCITRYMHLNKLLVKSGQKVKCGDNIALSGNTGRSTGPHLHFEIWVDRRPVDPLIINMLNMEKLSGNDRMIYLSQIKKIMSQLCFD